MPPACLNPEIVAVMERELARRAASGRRSKYGVDQSEAGRLARTYSGRVYASLAEARYAAILDLRKKVGEIKEWWAQQTIPLVVNGVVVAKMVADFKLLLTSGNAIEYVEIKGALTETYQLKRKLLRAIYPDIRYTVIPSKDVR
jgi:hypothetical protein